MSGLIPRQFIDQLLARVDIVEIVSQRLDLRKAGREYTACCPFHTEKTPSFTVSPGKQFYHCFGCGAHGNAIDFLMAYEHLDFPDAIEDLARSAGLEVPRATAFRSEDSSTSLYRWLDEATRFFQTQLCKHPAAENARTYLRRRGLDETVIKAFDIGYAPPGWDSLLQALSAKGATLKELITAGLVIANDKGGGYDRFRHRIVFPISDRRGRCIAFGGRALDDDTKPKYLNSPETPCFHKGRELYGLYQARTRERRIHRMLIVEGYMDVVALAQHGITYTAATLGTATTAEHLERLFRVSKDIVFCFDGDRAGREAAWRALDNALPLLRDGRQISYLFLPDGEDPDSLVRKIGREDFEHRIDTAVPLSEYFFERLGADVNLDSLDGRARLAERARPLLQKLPDGVFRDMMIQRLAEIAKIVATRVSSAPPPPAVTPKQIILDRSPMRLTIALLLHDPKLALQVDDIDDLKGIDVPGMAIFTTLIDFLRSNPHVDSAARILAHYADTEIGKTLEQLLQGRFLRAEDSYKSEFYGAIKEFKRRYSRQWQYHNELAQDQQDKQSS